MQKRILDFGREVKEKHPKSIYYLLTFLTDLSIGLHATTYVLFLLGNGLDLFQVMLVNVVFMAGNFIFEIPTGAYADYFGRKRSIILSYICFILTLLIYFESSTLPMFILAEIIAALAFTFASGALDAWVVDALKQKGYEGRIDFIFSHAGIIGPSASLIGGLIGGYLGSINLGLPFGIGAVISFAALLVTIFYVKEEFKVKKSLSLTNSIYAMSKVAQDSINYGLKHKVVLWLIISGVVAVFAFQPLNMYWAPRMNSLAGNQIWLLGWMWVGISLALMSGSFIMKTLLKKDLSYFWIAITMALFLSLPILISSMSNVLLIALTGFITYEVGRGMFKPIYQAYLNKYIPSEQRATIISFYSMMNKTGAIAGLIILGWIAKNSSIQLTWILAGLILLILIPIFLRVRSHEKDYT